MDAAEDDDAEDEETDDDAEAVAAEAVRGRNAADTGIEANSVPLRPLVPRSVFNVCSRCSRLHAAAFLLRRSHTLKQPHAHTKKREIKEREMKTKRRTAPAGGGLYP